MNKTKIILLYKDSFEKGNITTLIRRSNIEILSKNKGIINLKDKCIILKKLNVNKANQLCKYKDNLILYNYKDEQIEELKERCSANLKITDTSHWIKDKYITQYLRENANNLQIRYIVDIDNRIDVNCVHPIYTMVTDTEKDLSVVSDKNIRNGKNLYLNINDAIDKYKEVLTISIKKMIKDKEDLEKTLVSKGTKQAGKKGLKEGICRLNYNIECYKKLVKKPNIIREI